MSLGKVKMAARPAAAGHDSEGEMEDGELRIYDKDSYIDSNGQVFAFKRDKSARLDWNQIGLFGSEYEGLLNLYQSYEEFAFGVPAPTLQERQGAAQILRNSADFTHHIRSNLEQIAFVDLEQEPKSREVTTDGLKALKILQFGMQYYMFAQRHLTSKCTVLHDYLAKQNAELERLEELHRKVKARLRKQRHVGEQLNEQAIHYEVLMRRLRPDILEKRLQALEATQGQRKDISAADEEDARNVVPGILQEQGLMKEGQSTIVYDRVAHLGRGERRQESRDAENSELREQLKKVDMVLQELQELKGEVAKATQGVRASGPALPAESPAQAIALHRQQSTQKYQSPVREFAQENFQQNNRTTKAQQYGPAAGFLANNAVPLQDSVEESIRSQTSSQFIRPRDDSSSAPVVASYPEQIHVDPISTSGKASGALDRQSDKLEDSSSQQKPGAPGPALRRVCNPYVSPDPSASISKSAGSSSSVQHHLPGQPLQNRSKAGNRNIEIEKVTDDDEGHQLDTGAESAMGGWAHQSRLGPGVSQSHGTEDSYQDDDFDSHSLSRSRDHKLQEQIDQERDKQNLQKQVQLNRQVAKMRHQAPSKDAATPIKEEAVEEESDHESDPRKKKKNGLGLPLDNTGLQNWASRGSLEKGNSGRLGQPKASSEHASQRTFERDSRQDDLQDELRMIEEQSKQSQSNSVPIENESGSGHYVSLVEKARNMGHDKGGLGGTQRTAIGESSSLANEDLKKAGLGTGINDFPPSANRSNSAKKSGKKEMDDDEDDYIDDEFEDEDESGSGAHGSSLKPFPNPQKYESHSSQRDLKDHARSGGPPSQTEIDWNISASQSMLPPSGAPGKRGDATDALLSAYNVNLAESASLDFPISSSMGGGDAGAARRMTHQTRPRRERDHSLGDGTESMNSSDFAVSQSKLSSSQFGSYDQKAQPGQRSAKQKQRSYTQHQAQGRSSSGTTFYQPNFSKFSNFHTTDSQQPAVEEDIEQR